MASEKIDVIYNFVDKSSAGISSAIGGITSLGKAAAGAAAAGIATVAVGMAAAGAAAISLGSSAEEMQGKFNVVFAETGGMVTNQLNDFADEVGRSKFELQGMASTFGDTLKPMGFSESAAADMSVTLSKLATDLGSFNDMEMDEALQRLQSTLIGNHENALAFGVIINENTLKQELARMGADKLTGSLLEQAKAQARMNLVIAGTTDAQGDAARTSESFANQMRALKATVFDAGTEIGLSLLPMVTPLVSKFGELAKMGTLRLVPMFEDISGAVGRFFDLSDRGMPLVPNVETLIDALGSAIGLPEELTAEISRLGGVIAQLYLDISNGEGVVESFTTAFKSVTTEETQTSLKNLSQSILDSIAEFQKLTEVGAEAFQVTKTAAEEESVFINSVLIGIGVTLAIITAAWVASGVAAGAAAGVWILALTPLIALAIGAAVAVGILAYAWQTNALGIQETLTALGDQFITILTSIDDFAVATFDKMVARVQAVIDTISLLLTNLGALNAFDVPTPSVGNLPAAATKNTGGALPESGPASNPSGAGVGGGIPQGSNNTTIINNNMNVTTNSSESQASNDFAMMTAAAGGV